MNSDYEKRLNDLRRDFDALNAEFYANNFTASQDMNKYIRINSRLKIPTLATSPSTCEVGELHVLSTNGKLYVCSATNTWTAQT